MLQRLENAYLAILRTVVILASGILLLGVVFFGLGAFKGFGDVPVEKVAPPQIKPDSLISKISTVESEDIVGGVSQSQDQITTNADPDQKYYDAIATKMTDFVSSYSGGNESVDRPSVLKVTKDHADVYDVPDVKTAYVKGLSEAVNKILGDKKIQGLPPSGIDVINKLLNSYTDAFNADLKAQQEKFEAAKLEHAKDKADSSSNLYAASASFGLFLLIVFLSIFIKIERNLRHLEPRTPSV